MLRLELRVLFGGEGVLAPRGHQLSPRSGEQAPGRVERRRGCRQGVRLEIRFPCRLGGRVHDPRAAPCQSLSHLLLALLPHGLAVKPACLLQRFGGGLYAQERLALCKPCGVLAFHR